MVRRLQGHRCRHMAVEHDGLIVPPQNWLKVSIHGTLRHGHSPVHFSLIPRLDPQSRSEKPTVSVHATHVLSWMLNLRCGGKGHAVNMVVSFRLCSVVLYRLSVCIRGCQKKKNLWCPLMRNYSRDVWCLQNDKGRLLCDHLGCRIHQLYIRNHKDQKKEKGAWSVFSHDFLWAKKTSCVEMKRKIFLCWDKKIRQKLKISDGRE